MKLLLSALSFIILLCLEDAQGQFLSRPGLHFQNRRRADYFRHQQSPLNRNKKHTRRKNSSSTTGGNNASGLVVKNEVQDLPPGKYEMVAIFDEEQDNIQSALLAASEGASEYGSSSAGLYPHNEALLVYNPKYFENEDDESANLSDRIDRGTRGGGGLPWAGLANFKLENVYPLFPPGTSPFDGLRAKRPRRRPAELHPPPPHRAVGYTPQPSGYSPQPPNPYVHAYHKPEPDYTKPPYVAPEPEEHYPAKPFSFPTPKPTFRPHTPQYQHPTPSYDDHLPYQLHPEPDYHEPEPAYHKPEPEPAYHKPEPTPKPFVHHQHTPKPFVHHQHSPKPYQTSYHTTPKTYSYSYNTTPKPVKYGYTPTPEPEYHEPEYHEPAPPEPEYVRPPSYNYEEPETAAYSPTPKPEIYEPHHNPYKPIAAKPYEPEEPYRHPNHQYDVPEPYEPKYHPALVPAHETYEPEYEPPPYEPVEHYEEPYQPTPKPYEPSPKYAPTPKPHSPLIKPYVSPTPHAYTPTPKPYAPTPAPYSPSTPKPVSPYPTTPKPYEASPTPYAPVPHSPTPKPYAPTPKPPVHPSPYSPTPAPYTPTPAPYTPTPAPYSPTPKTYSYKTTPKYYEPTPEPYEPTPKPYEPTPKPYEPTPKPYQPTPKPYVPTTPKPYAPTPRPYKPTPEPYQPTPKPYEEEIYQPYKPEPEYDDYEQSKYSHFPIKESIPYKSKVTPKPYAPPPTPTPQPYIPPTPTPRSNYRLPKKQEFSNFPALYNNPYNDFAEHEVAPPKGEVKRKIPNSDFDGSSNLVTPIPEVKPNNKQRKPLNALDKLKAIAGVKDSAAGDLVSDAKPFICPSDGHFGDPDDCTKFYKCAHGTPIVEYCPATLFWNQATEQCDWPENSLCQFNPDAVKAKVLTEKTYLYLTFDDGPNEGTNYVIDALADYDVRATFFINSDNMYDSNTAKAEDNQRSLLKIVDGGHTLADHSFDHMSHNSKDSPQNAYTNVEQDMQYFGEMNIGPVLDLLWSNGRREVMNLQNYTLSNFIRMPYTNNWRVPSMRITHDCSRCTVPASSGQRGIEIANLLAAEGKKVIGWDDEWGVNWSSNTLNYGGAAAYQKLNRRHTKSPKKIVLLMHDVAFRSPEASDELRTFVKLAQDSGYVFSTIDQYETDL